MNVRASLDEPVHCLHPRTAGGEVQSGVAMVVEYDIHVKRGGVGVVAGGIDGYFSEKVDDGGGIVSLTDQGNQR